MTELADRVVLHLKRAGSGQRQKAEAKMSGPGESKRHIHEVALEAAGGDRAQAGGQLQGS